MRTGRIVRPTFRYVNLYRETFNFLMLKRHCACATLLAVRSHRCTRWRIHLCMNKRINESWKSFCM
jgi:hypothetical protein